MIESLIPHPWHLPIWCVVVTLACLIFCGAIRWQSAIRFTTAVIVLSVGFALGAVSSFAWPADRTSFPRFELVPVVVEYAWLLSPMDPGLEYEPVRDTPKARSAAKAVLEQHWTEEFHADWLARYEWDLREPESPHPPLPAP